MLFRAVLFMVSLSLVGAASPAHAHAGPHVEIEEVSKQLAYSPADPGLLLRRASLHRELGQHDLAVLDLDRAAAILPAHRGLFLERGLIHEAQGNLAQAEIDLDAYLASGPAHVDALSARARIREADGRHAAAIDDYNAALVIRPVPELYLARGRAQERRGDLEAAERGYREGLQRLGGAVVLRAALVDVLVRRGRHTQALAVIDELLPRLPVKAEWTLRRADVLAAAGRHQEARRTRLEALREVDALLARRPDGLRHLLRARVYRALDRNEEARVEVQAALKASPRLESAQRMLAELGSN